VRELINKYGAYIAIGVIVVALVVAWFFTGTSAPPTGDLSQGFFIDEETGEESVHPITAIPPLMGKSGKPTVVRAYKFSCEGGKNPQTIYLQKYIPEAQERLKNMSPDDLDRDRVMSRGELVRLPGKDKPWVRGTSTEAIPIRTLPDCPGGKAIVMVSPR
jgi:hypothetical protein